MDKRMLASQARTGVQEIINVNKILVTISRKQLIDNGMGKMVADNSKASLTHTVKCRLSHMAEGPFYLTQSPSGLSTSYSRYMLVDYNQDIKENDTFTYDSKQFRIGPVDVLSNFNVVVGYQAPLFEIKTI